MQNKVVSYELCKELHELGFESESHTGWWCNSGNERGWCWYDYEYDTKYTRKIKKVYKAWDCHDLLMWLKDSNKTWKLDYFCKNFDVDVVGNESEDQYDPENILFENDTYSDLNPANALAKAIIAILKEKKDGN